MKKTDPRKVAPPSPSTAQPPTVTFNNKTYLIQALPQDVQELIGVHQTWNGELTNQRREVFKLEAAIRGLMSELEIRFKAVDDAAAASVPMPQGPSPA